MAKVSEPQGFYTPTEVTESATSLPPRVLDLGFKVLNGSANDADVFNFDTVGLTFTYSEEENEFRSRATHFLIQTTDMDTGTNQGYIQYANRRPYKYWQRTVEREDTSQFDELLYPGTVNGRVYITPINGLGQGDKTSFILPFKNLSFIGLSARNANPTALVLAKYWHLYSKTPNCKVNRPKVMHIYMDVSIDDVLLDKAMLNEDEYGYTSIGDWKVTNQEMFRWLIQNNNIYQRLDSFDNLIDMSQEEIEFMNHLIDSFNSFYREHMFNNPFDDEGNPTINTVFKIAVENPRDHNDSIIIYIMKGERWRV